MQSFCCAPQDIQDGWEYAVEYHRDNALIVQMAKSLGLTSAEVDGVFGLAATL